MSGVSRDSSQLIVHPVVHVADHLTNRVGIAFHLPARELGRDSLNSGNRICVRALSIQQFDQSPLAPAFAHLHPAKITTKLGASRERMAPGTILSGKWSGIRTAPWQEELHGGDSAADSGYRLRKGRTVQKAQNFHKT